MSFPPSTVPTTERERESERKWSRSIVSDSLRPYGLQPTRRLHPWDFPGKSTGVGCHFLLQGIFPTQGSNPGLQHCRQILYRLSHQRSRDSPMFAESLIKWVWTHKCGVFFCLIFYIWFLAKKNICMCVCIYIYTHTYTYPIGSREGCKSMVRHHLDYCVTFLFPELELGLPQAH